MTPTCMAPSEDAGAGEAGAQAASATAATMHVNATRVRPSTTAGYRLNQPARFPEPRSLGFPISERSRCVVASRGEAKRHIGALQRAARCRSNDLERRVIHRASGDAGCRPNGSAGVRREHNEHGLLGRAARWHGRACSQRCEKRAEVPLRLAHAHGLTRRVGLAPYDSRNARSIHVNRAAAARDQTCSRGQAIAEVHAQRPARAREVERRVRHPPRRCCALPARSSQQRADHHCGTRPPSTHVRSTHRITPEIPPQVCPKERCRMPVRSRFRGSFPRSGSSGDEGGHDVVRVAIEVAPGAVVAGGRAGIGVAGRDLDVA